MKLSEEWGREPEWFRKDVMKVMAHNDYEEGMDLAKACDERGYWSPVDLMMREYYNNGGGSAKGFLGISTSECIRCAEHIVANQGKLREMGAYSKDGFNNFGFPLWKDYELSGC